MPVGEAKSRAPIGCAVVPMTTCLFACAKKISKLSALDQEAYFKDNLIVIRHAERQDHVDHGWKGTHLLSAQDPPLSKAGRMQSFETALKYFALQREKVVEERIRGRVSFLLLSPFHRCVETALILNIVAFKGSLAMFVNPQLSDWQQTKVYRSSPILSGGYMVLHAQEADRERNKKLIFFTPQIEALRASLVPFLKMRADEIAENKSPDCSLVPLEVARKWVPLLGQWFDSHSTVPVWTHHIAHSLILEKIEATNLRPIDRSHCLAPVSLPKTELKMECKEVVYYCGTSIKYPERKSDLLQRCEQVIETCFLNSTSSISTIPALVRTSVEMERHTQLPKYFIPRVLQQRHGANPTEPLALLPPLNVMVITHADVIAGLMEVCCPKYVSRGANASVPYCSITTLTRHNNYYHIPSSQERQKIDGIIRTSRTQSHRNQKKKRSSACRQNALSCNVFSDPLTQGAESVSSFYLPLNWQVRQFASTELLRTRIIIRYD